MLRDVGWAWPTTPMTERANRSSVAFPNRGDLTRTDLARSLGSCQWSQMKRRRQRKRKKGICKGNKKDVGGREQQEDKERQTHGGGGGGWELFPWGITLGVSLHWSF